MRGQKGLLFGQAHKLPAGRRVFLRQASDAGQRTISDAAAGKGQPHPEETRVSLRVDSHVIGLRVARKGELTMPLEMIAEALLGLGKNPLYTPIGNQKFEARSVAFGTVALIPVQLAYR